MKLEVRISHPKYFRDETYLKEIRDVIKYTYLVFRLIWIIEMIKIMEVVFLWNIRII